MSPEAVVAALARHRSMLVDGGAARKSAVLVPLALRGDALEVILIRRTADLGAHSGQVAFPGGKIEAADSSPEAAALREAHEELGIAPSSVEVVGRLDELFTVTGFHIVPVTGLVRPDVVLTPSPLEVARVFTVPLAHLLEEARWQLQRHEWGGSTFDVWHFPHDGEDVWGATAHMLRGMVELLRSAR